MSLRNISFAINNSDEATKQTTFAVKFVSQSDENDTSIRVSDLTVREKFVQYEENDTSHAAQLQQNRTRAIAALARRVKQINNCKAKLQTLMTADILVSDKDAKEDENA